ncbi:MAG: Flp pilus assembly complex ATPase component TadA [Phycisphaerales bacterium]|nr:MAG: Flp pilus assembly complex ATPase component TadA [Phycisphaerales bacterium]
MPTDLLTALAVQAFLVSPWKPVVMLLPFIPWAWLISSKLDKDARKFRLNPQVWNSLHLTAGVFALIAMLFIPLFWASWPVGVLILLAPILIYWRVRNGTVPEAQRFYLTGETLTARMTARRQSKAAKDAVIRFIDAEGSMHDLPLKDDPEYALHMLAEDFIGPAIEARAYRMELAVGPNGVSLSQMVDGMRFKREPVTQEDALQLIDYVKEYAGLDVGDRRRQQTGEFKIEGPAGKSKLTITTAGSSSGQILRIDVNREERLSLPFDGLGLLPSQIEELKILCELQERHGLVLLSSPPGHGLSTSMYAFIGRHDPYTSNIKTLEREIQLWIDGVDHILWDPANPDLDYATHLQSILRRDPDIVMVDLVKDADTAQAIVEPGMVGPLLYVPQRAESVTEQIRVWVKLVGNVAHATKALRAVVNQRLLRTLCANCKQGYQPTDAQLKQLNIPASKVSQLYRAHGKIQVKNKIETCPVCRGTGYLGQAGVFEVMTVDEEARKHLAGGDLKAALGHARRNKMIYLQEAALSKVISGDTTIEEVIRVTTPSRAGGATSPAAARGT